MLFLVNTPMDRQINRSPIQEPAALVFTGHKIIYYQWKKNHRVGALRIILKNLINPQHPPPKVLKTF